MTTSERPICVSWRCPRSLNCLMHYCHHTWAEIVDAKASGRTIHLWSTGEGCTDYTEDFARELLDVRATPQGRAPWAGLPLMQMDARG